jgi:hypothetical protein
MISELIAAAEAAVEGARAAQQRCFEAREALYSERRFLEDLVKVRARVEELEAAAEAASIKQAIAEARAQSAIQQLRAAQCGGENAVGFRA